MELDYFVSLIFPVAVLILLVSMNFTKGHLANIEELQ